jgi:hypothetical protein
MAGIETVATLISLPKISAIPGPGKPTNMPIEVRQVPTHEAKLH